MKVFKLEMEEEKTKEWRQGERVKTKLKTKTEHKKMNNTHKSYKQTQIGIPTGSFLKTPEVGLITDQTHVDFFGKIDFFQTRFFTINPIQLYLSKFFMIT